MSPRAALFVAVSRISAHLPAFRGRARIFLTLFNLLRLKGAHVIVDARLRQPIPYRATLDLGSWLQRIAFLVGEYESDTVRFLLRLHQSMSRPGYLLDVGANIGLISIPFAILRTAGGAASSDGYPLVVACEAVRDNFQVLRENVERNALGGKLILLHQALGDVSKAVEIQVEGDLGDGEGTGTANILADHSTWNCVRLPIQIHPFDELRREGTIPSGCSVVKIDTDGYDLKVLQGAISLLQSDRPVIFGEFAAQCMNWHSQSIHDVIELASQYRYRTCQRKPGTWLFSTSIDSKSYSQDLLLVPEERVGDVQWCLTPAIP